MGVQKITVQNIQQQIAEFAPSIFKEAIVYEPKKFKDERSFASIHATAKPETVLHPNAIIEFLMTNMTQEEFTKIAMKKLGDHDAAQGIRSVLNNILRAMKKSPKVVEKMFKVLDKIISLQKNEQTKKRAIKPGEYFDETNLVRCKRQIMLFVDLLKTNLEQTNKSLNAVLEKLKSEIKNPSDLASLFVKQPEEQGESSTKPNLANISSPKLLAANTLTAS